MEGFLVEINSKEELINVINELNKIGALGTDIVYSTYLSDSYNVNDIINEKEDVWNMWDNDYHICALTIDYDVNDYRNTKFPNVFGKNHIQVSMSTYHDAKMGDVPGKKVSYKEMIKETIKLMNSK